MATTRSDVKTVTELRHTITKTAMKQIDTKRGKLQMAPRMAAALVLFLFASVPTAAFVRPHSTPTKLCRSSIIPAAPANREQALYVFPPFLADSSSLVLSNTGVLESAALEGSSYLTVLGSSAIMLTIVSLLYSWEKTISFLKSTVPKSLLPVLESILAEIGGLGFIGLILSTFLPPNKEMLEELSLFLFREEDVAIETFEFLHEAIFQVGVGFFLAAGAMVAVGLSKLEEINEFEELQVDATTGSCSATPTKIASLLPEVLQEDPNELPQVNLWQEIVMDKEARAGRSLLLRDRLVKQYDLPNTFRIEKYISLAFSENLLEMVELSPLTWIYLIPALALANSIDLSHDVVNAASPNAAASAGYFFSTPASIVPSIFTVALSLVWGLWNCWKVTQIKYMILPRLGTNKSGDYEILPPPMDDASLRDAFSSSPWWVSAVERLWAEPPQNKCDELFGTAGAAGVELYRNSIQKETWLCITHIVFFGTQIVPRDVGALLTGAVVGDPTNLVPELITYSIFVSVSIAQLVLITPRAFWNFCLVSCAIENAESKEMLEKCREGKADE